MKSVFSLRIAFYLAIDDRDSCFTSNDQQEDQLRPFLEDRKPDGWILEEGRIYRDELTQEQTTRTDLERLLDAAESGGIDLVLVHRLDRLATSAITLIRIIYRLREAGVSVVSLSENFDTRRHDHWLTVCNFRTLLIVEGMTPGELAL